jgi:predicted O-methyltransferase YrrM
MTFLERLKGKCIADSIPIVRDQTLQIINSIINKYSYSYILELGTAYGYSAYQFSLNKYVKKIISIEKDEFKYQTALNLLRTNKKIKLVHNDIFTYKSNVKFDLIFVDGPKSHQKDIVEKYFPYLKTNGTMIIDNIFLRKFDGLQVLTKNQKKLLTKVNAFHK